MKVIVTGGAGFIGSHIAKATGGHVVDNFSAGYRENIKGLEFSDISVTDLPKLRQVFDNVRPEVVYHNAASKKNICLKYPMRDLAVNAEGSYNVALLCREFGARMVHASTGSVYGEAQGVQDERHPINPVSYYGISKYAGECYARQIADAVVLRYFHVYGKNQETAPDRGGVIAIWLDRIKKGLPVVVYGDGTQQRSLTHVDDVVRANLLDLKPGVYNVASGIHITLNEVLGILKKHYDFEVIQKEWMPGDIKTFNVKSKLNLDWIPFEKGLEITI